MTLRLVKDGEPAPAAVLLDRWNELKARGDAMLASGELSGFFILLDGAQPEAAICGPGLLQLLWAVRRSAEQAIDEAVFGE